MAEKSGINAPENVNDNRHGVIVEFLMEIYPGLDREWVHNNINRGLDWLFDELTSDSKAGRNSIEFDADVVVSSLAEIYPNLDHDWARRNAKEGFHQLVNRMLSDPMVGRDLGASMSKAREQSTSKELSSVQPLSPILKLTKFERCHALIHVFYLPDFRSKYRAPNEMKFYPQVVTILRDEFPQIPVHTVRHVAFVWRGNIAPSYTVLLHIVCGFPQTLFGDFLLKRKYHSFAPNGTELGIWRPFNHLPSINDLPETIASQIKLIERLLLAVSQKSLFFTSPSWFKKRECTVCYCEYPLILGVRCAKLNTAVIVPYEGSDEEEIIPDDGSGHWFCLECIEGQASASTGGTPLAGPLGLRCMQRKCNGVIPWEQIRPFLPQVLRYALDERFVQENLIAAKFDYLERCPQCDYMADAGGPLNVCPLFDCAKCGAFSCRRCHRVYDKYHRGKTCEEVTLIGEDAVRDEERRLSEAAAHQCSRCLLLFVKTKGCNMMTCRCGMTQCYLCGSQPIDYDHFCRHARDPNKPGVCNSCTKKCLLFA